MDNSLKLQKRTPSFLEILRSYGTLIAGLLIVLCFCILQPDTFATLDNAITVSRQISFLVMIALGATLIMAVGEFDLSIGAMASLGGIFAAQLAVAGYPIWAAYLITLVVAFIIGFINGWIVTRFRVLSFITTLGMGTILGGFTFWLSDGATIFEGIPASFRYIGQEKLFNLPFLSFIMLILTLIFWYLMSQTTFGRKLYAIGGNEAAARASGIRIRLNKNMAFALCALLASLTGILMASRLGSAQPTGGDGLFLPAYAAVFLGMTTFKEGIPNIWGTFLGATILGILENGLTIMEVPPFLQNVITGLIVIAAVVLQKIGQSESR
ncbi:ribose transport system permease protein [Seinonella peptonophila]|uniref:Ribose transport system permease protein n=1 Tax=Seinonella peptonophila TaxID=112248 RepID=A0A1M4X974_9BACL|nr:ABC transporter permease [Seinonella peptonophila]SHE90070.1 ribose transport system permease protein [Seinonella peptonophila]